MTLASDAMKGLNTAETAINSAEKSTEKPAEKVEEKVEKPATEKKVKLSPEQAQAVIDMAALKQFIEKNKLGVEDRAKNKIYVKAEVYQFIAQQRGLFPTFLTEEFGTRGESSYGCKTVCILRTKEGVEVSRSSMTASKKEKWLSGLDDFATMGLSQTRAMARAVKNIYGYLLTAIGYQATPIEEINNNEGE